MCAGIIELPLAYIGPGAGIALVGSFLAVLTALASAGALMVSWPLRRLWRTIRGQRALRQAHVDRVVILGLDGLEPSLTEAYLDQGLLPNLARLRDQGTYRRLGTTWPPLSPVAWSSFSTGTNPGKHNIFDFISRCPATYRPEVSSVRIGAPRRILRLGKYVLPLSRANISLLRKSKPFWAVLSESRVFSAILRVPITFPPDRFDGVQLAAMCVPDLLGTQGTFFHYTDEDRHGESPDHDDAEHRIPVERQGTRIRSFVRGPANPLRAEQCELRLPFTVEPAHGRVAAVMRIDGERVELDWNRFTDWVRVSFALAPGIRMHGLCKFLLKRFGERFEMYSTPVQIDPDRPLMPIAQPTVFSSYLARSQGPFATLGLAEDTGALSEKVLSEDAFLAQAYGIHEERKAMFFDALERVRRGAVVCVFDGPDRIQHMFWRFLEDTHPALRGTANTHRDTIRDMYRRMDTLVGQTMDKLDEKTALLVMSDHGFNAFRRGVDLNAWLLENGYLALRGAATTSRRSYLAEVDWSRTRAYAMGLAGMFINEQGREAQGIVAPGAAKQQLVAELAGRLTGLCDPQTGEVAIREAVPREKVYSGPYVEAAPDLIVGYNRGYRVSWDSAVGKTSESVFSDNTKPWSGDHCVHPDLVPGVLFASLKLETNSPRITDIAPTTLTLLGIEPPAYMDGQSLV